MRLRTHITKNKRVIFDVELGHQEKIINITELTPEELQHFLDWARYVLEQDRERDSTYIFIEHDVNNGAV
jgi:hypothetical protein